MKAPTQTEWQQLGPAGQCTWYGTMFRLRWELLRHDHQIPGNGRDDWFVHFLRAGRGAGKTRAFSEYALQRILEHPGTRVGFQGPTFNHVKKYMLWGKSGILTLLPDTSLYQTNLNDRTVTFANGSVVEWFSSEKPGQTRGPEFHLFWGDEPGEWWNGVLCWKNLRGAVRLSGLPGGPQIVLSGTPKAVPLMKYLRELRTGKLKHRFTMSRASTMDNVDNLDPAFLEGLRDEYEGTTYWEQEVLGHEVEQAEGALWEHNWIREGRSADAGKFDDVVLSIDPSDSWKGDECGLIVGARGSGKNHKTGKPGKHGYILADETVQEPLSKWSQRLPDITKRHGVSTWLIEKSLGERLRETLDEVKSENDLRVKIKYINALGSKATRAEPASRQYQQGKWTHLVDTPGGDLKLLEAEMTMWEPAEDSKSPNRIDALAYLCTHLLKSRSGAAGMSASDAAGQ